MNNLKTKAFGGLLFLLIIMGAFLFIPAGTFNYWQAWVFLVVFGGSAVLITLYLMKNDQKLLERRVQAGPTAEKEISQKIIQTITAIGFIALLVVPGLDFRFHWTSIPFFAVLVGDILLAIGFYLIFIVFKQNSFTSATIEVYSEQKVISTGLYSLVRHPMYMGALVMFIGMILSLGSLLGFVVFFLMMPALIWRLMDEEKFLSKSLPGYREYIQRVKYHLIPFVW